MKAVVIDGRAASARLQARIANAVEVLDQRHHEVPTLATVLVGEDPASEVYVRTKQRRAREAGIRSREIRLPGGTTTPRLLERLEGLNEDSEVDAVLVQLPLPDAVDTRRVINAVDPGKDVDGFHRENVGRLAAGEPGMVPCTPLGCTMLLEETLGSLEGADAVVVGRSAIVGRPMALLLTQRHCTVTLAHSRTKNLPDVCRRADILVVAAGRPEMVRGDWVRPGSTVIDVGINRIERDGARRLVGDVAFDEVRDLAGAITPVPGGVGPMTVACLLANTLTLHCRRRNREEPG